MHSGNRGSRWWMLREWEQETAWGGWRGRQRPGLQDLVIHRQESGLPPEAVGSHGKALSNEVTAWSDLSFIQYCSPSTGNGFRGIEFGVAEGRPEIWPLPTSWWGRDDGGLGRGSGGREGEVMDLRHGFQVKSPGLVTVTTTQFWSLNSPFQFFWITVPIHSKQKVETT